MTSSRSAVTGKTTAWRPSWPPAGCQEHLGDLFRLCQHLRCVILLGVEELPDHTLRVQGLLEPRELVDEFTALLQNRG